MDAHLQSTVNFLKKTYSGQEKEYQGQVTVTLKSEDIVPALTRLRDDYAFDMLELETAVDYWPQISPRFHLVYQVCSLEHNVQILLRVPLDGNAPSISTIEGVYPNANWHERELWDMFGIKFEGHSDHRRILMPADWAGHPLRKDYPLGYEEVQFSFNFDEISLRKPKPDKS
jgi:NADH-quinone oxidoreductase subunit C